MGTLDESQRPCKKRKGQTFERWVRELERLGYNVESRELRACDYGAPTIRKRLFVIARCDGHPIVWPEPTHGAPDDPRTRSGELKRHVSAAEIIDWSIPLPVNLRDQCRNLRQTRPTGATPSGRGNS